ncbi:hypothetical protein ABN028_19520 [Actinopolymorpha sp. B17G11]|uniref:hypothetical protein n=1 Tax=Actinopolymorpha sp. B17G11 TaxID=3160861 RepID=UPI0032E482A7
MTATTAVCRVLDGLRAAGFTVTEHAAHRAAVEVAFDNGRQGDAAVFGVIRVGVASGRFVGGNVTDAAGTRRLSHLQTVRQLARQ